MVSLDVPLSGVQGANPTLGGYEYLEWTGSVFHPGIDLNSGNSADADWGLPVRSPLKGEVVHVERWTGATGFGNHIWLWCPNEEVYLHFCHLDTINVFLGQTVPRDGFLGTCGKSGNWPWAHLHFEVTAAWLGANFWPVGWSAEEIASVYLDPGTYIRVSQPADTPVSPIMGDKEIADAVRAFGGNSDSPALWVSQIGALEEIERLLREEIKSLKETVAVRVESATLLYSDGSTQELK